MLQDEESDGLGAPGTPVEGVYALGDCCADLDRPLPALAQVGGGPGETGVAAGC